MDYMEEKAHIFGSVFALANRLQVLGDKFDENLTIKQWLLLAIISKNTTTPLTISEAANLIGNSRQNVKKMALILEKEGFLELKSDQKDARIIRIILTKKCIEYFKEREQREIEFIEQLFNEFDPKLILGLYQGMIRLEENIIKMEKRYENEK